MRNENEEEKIMSKKIKIFNDHYKEEKMCLLSTIKDLLASGSMKSASDVVAHMMQLIAYYDQNAANKDDQNDRDDYIDALIQILQQEKSKQ